MTHMPRAAARSPLSRTDFEQHLRTWRDANRPGATIGEVGDFGGRAWTYVSELGRPFRLHADTTWEGVNRYLEVMDEQPGADWWVTENQRGKKNKVVFGSDRETIHGFWLYEHGV